MKLINKYFIILLVLFAISCSSDVNTKIIHQEDVADCGLTPYTILGDKLFVDSTQKYEVHLSYIRVTREQDPEDINIKAIKESLKVLNRDFKVLNLTFVAKEILVIKNDDMFIENIQDYHKHASLFKKRGFINIFVYNSSMGGFSGAAGDIPSTYIGIKENALSTSLSHEIGHCLGLFHTHTIDDEGAEHSFDSGDLVCETPYADFFSTYINRGYLGLVDENCEYTGELGNLTQEEHNSNIRNIQSYSLLKCRKEINSDQIDRMKFIINNAEDLKECIHEI